MSISRRSFFGSLAALVVAPIAARLRPQGTYRIKFRWWTAPAAPAPRVYFSELHDPHVWPAPGSIGRIYRHNPLVVQFKTGRRLIVGDPVVLTPTGRARHARRTDDPEHTVGYATADPHDGLVEVLMTAPVTRL